MNKSIDNIAHINKRGVKEIFEIIVKRVILRNDMAELRSADYKALLKFIDVAYRSISMSKEKIVWSELDEDTYQRVIDMFSENCKNISYDKFARWIHNNKDEFSLYNINAKTIEEKIMQITFYINIKQIMFVIYEALNYDSYGMVKENYDNSMKIYELLKKEIWINDARENNYIKYKNSSITELKKDLEKLEKRAKGEHETVSNKELLEEMYEIVEEILSRKGLSKMDFKDFVNKKKKLFVCLRKINTRSRKEEYRLKVKRDIRENNINHEEGDPKHIELVTRCIEILEKNPRLSIDRVIDEVEKEIDSRKSVHKNVLIENNTETV